MSRQEAAEFLGVHVNTLDRWVRGGQIGYLRVGRSIQFTEANIKQFITDREQPVVAVAPTRRPGRAA